MTVSVSTARKQFKNSGLIRHDLLRKQIIASWERSRIYGIDEESLVKSLKLATDSIDDSTDQETPSQGMLFIVDEYGKIISRTGRLDGLSGLEIVSESVIGTSAFSICALNGKYEKVEFEEHYIDILSPFISECFKISSNRYTLLFSVHPVGSKRLLELGGELFDNHKNRLTERFTKREIQTEFHVCMAGISREICNARASIAEYSNNQKGTIAFCAASELLLKSMVGLLETDLNDEMIIQVWNVDELKNMSPDMIKDKFVLFVDVHRYSFKNQMLLLRMFQDNNNKSKGYIWGFTSTDGIDMTSIMVTSGLQGYLNCPRVILHDIGHRRMDIPFICRSLFNSLDQGHRVSESFTDQLIRMNSVIRTDDLLAYLEFLHATLPIDMPLRYDGKAELLLSPTLNRGNEGFDKKNSQIFEMKSDMKADVNSDNKADMKSIERAAILRALENNNNVLKSTAAELGIGRTTLYRKMRAYSIII